MPDLQWKLQQLQLSSRGSGSELTNLKAQLDLKDAAVKEKDSESAGKYVTKIVKVFMCYVRYSVQIHRICHALKGLIPKRVDCFTVDGARRQIDNEDIAVMKRWLLKISI